jgi:hypothetical protein
LCSVQQTLARLITALLPGEANSFHRSSLASQN